MYPLCSELREQPAHGVQGDVWVPGLHLQGGHGDGAGRVQVWGPEDLHEPDLSGSLHLPGSLIILPPPSHVILAAHATCLALSTFQVV